MQNVQKIHFQRITPFMWFEDQAEEAARFYTGIFSNSRITNVTYYSDAGRESHGRPAGSVMVVAFELDGQPFAALNGGPQFRFNESISFVVNCQSQEEVDYYAEKLAADPEAQQCGWLKDKYGASWQIVPTIVPELLADPESDRTRRAMLAMMKMKKLDVAALQRAYDGK
jgi:predicted 3-demethylubiquinone-9 3-methyltransferase (glyoxalase superfamily)